MSPLFVYNYAQTGENDENDENRRLFMSHCVAV